MDTIDIDTTQAAPALTITNDKHLADVVHQLASKQLILNQASAEQQAKIEAIKKAFGDATEDLSKEIEDLFAAVEAYAMANKERLFPTKGGKTNKTFVVLKHKLQFRSAASVEAVSNAVDLIERMIDVVSDWDSLDGNWCGVPKDDVYQAFKDLLRQPPKELNKEALLSQHAAKTPLAKALLEYLHLHGIRVKTTETFKLSFTFTPGE
jgi:phage host-nuclease inhibitor protein Gam